MDIFVESMKIGKVKGVIINPEEWKLTHLEVELTKKAANEILGAKSDYNTRQLIATVGTGAYDHWVAVGLFGTDLGRWVR